MDSNEVSMTEVARNRRRAMDAVSALHAWTTVSRAILGEGELKQMLDLIAETAASLTGQAFAAVLLVDEDGTQLKVRGAHGLSPKYVERINNELPLMLHLGSPGLQTPSGRAYVTGRSSVTHQDSADRVSQWAELAAEQGYTSVASAPLVIPGRHLGALNVYAVTHTDFSHSQIMLLEALAAEAAAAIQIMEMRTFQQATIKELEQSDRMQQALATVALADEGLDPITTTLAELTGLGIAVEDRLTGDLLSAAGLGDRPMEVVDAARREFKSGGAHHDDVLPRLELRPWPADVVSLEPVTVGTETVAYLWAHSCQDPMPLQRRVLERGAVLVALELLKQRGARAAEWRVRGELLEQLMAAEPADEHRVFYRARTLGHDLAIAHTPIVFRPDLPPSRANAGKGEVDGSPGLQRIVAIAHAATAGHEAKPLIGMHAGSVLVLWPAASRPATEIAEIIRKRISSRTQATVSACVADSCTTLREYGRSIRQALGVLRLLQASGARDRLASLDELGIFRVLVCVEDEALLTDTARRVLGPLIDYDTAKNSSMMETLSAFLDADMNIADTARELHLHPNTLHYRIGRIEDLLGAKLRSPHDLVHISFALAIRKLGSSPTP
jgi:sugar diacid utilization regulator/GAF domain-containing protein